MDDKTITLSDGTEVIIRAPLAGDLRGLNLLDVLQLNPTAHAQLLERISTVEKAQFWRLGAADMMRLMTECVSFFAPEEAGMDLAPSPPPSKTLSS